MKDIFELVREANLKRKYSRDNFGRRLGKYTEELGEAWQAFLSVSSSANDKNKTFADVREELVDSLVVGIDLLLTSMPDQVETTQEEREELIYQLFLNKLSKWKKSRDNRTTTVDEQDTDE